MRIGSFTLGAGAPEKLMKSSTRLKPGRVLVKLRDTLLLSRLYGFAPWGLRAFEVERTGGLPAEGGSRRAVLGGPQALCT